MKKVENCMVCPEQPCIFDFCTNRWLSKKCPEGECDFLEGDKLILPPYCGLKSKTPEDCPKIKEVDNA